MGNLWGKTDSIYQVDDNTNILLESLASRVYDGAKGEFPLTGSVRNQIVEDLDYLELYGVLSSKEGSYVESHYKGDHHNLKRIDLVGRDGNPLYFTQRHPAEVFRSYMNARFPEKEFELRLKLPDKK